MLVPSEELHLFAPIQKVLRVWFKTGWAGVTLFFVLSGYLISSLIFNEFLNTGTVRFGRFYVRRGLKIYPAFYCMLACTLLLGYYDLHYFHRDLVPQEKLTSNIILSEVFFLQNYLGYIWVHVWSLAVEEHFYIGLGIVISLMMTLYPRVRHGIVLRDRFTLMPWFCVSTFGLCLALRYLYVRSIPATLSADAQMDLRYAGSCYTHLRIDSLLFGVFLAYFVKFRGEWFVPWVRRNTIGLLIAGLALISPSLIYEETSNFMLIPGFTMMYMGFGCLLLFTLYHPWKTKNKALNRVSGALAYIGQNSYSVYLWHYPVMVILEKLLPKSTNYYLVIILQNIAGLATGLIMAKLIEMPVLKMRDKFFTPTKALNAGV